MTHSQEQVDNWVDRGYSRFHKFRGKTEAERDADMARFFEWNPMISPFVPHAVRSVERLVRCEEVDYLAEMSDAAPMVSTGRETRDQKIISYGLSSYGYDIRIKAEGIKLFGGPVDGVIDPMRPYGDMLTDPEILMDEEFGLEYFILPPNTVALAHTVEYFYIPRDVLVTCLGKSTYARVGVSQIVTPLEPEWHGELVLEIASMIARACRVYLGTGIAQLLFNRGEEPCEVSYKDKGGKYQGQLGTQLAKI